MQILVDSDSRASIFLFFISVCFFDLKAWEEFRDLIPQNERGSLVDAYHRRLNSDDMETQVSRDLIIFTRENALNLVLFRCRSNYIFSRKSFD